MSKLTIKTPEQLNYMREGGKILAEILHEVGVMARPGVSCAQLNAKAHELMVKWHVESSFLGYHGFPAVICTAINEEVVHGIPGARVINDGDIVTIDCGVIHKGFHTDAAVTVLVGNVAPEVVKFVETVQKCFDKVLPFVKPGNKVGDIGFVIQQWIESNGYSVVRDYVGHGIGRQMHEDPQVPNFGQKNKGFQLVSGMAIAIEPIINMGARFVDTLEDDWTVVTRDGAMACQIEHTIAITESGPEVLTKYSGTINSVIINRI